ncbi:MAG: hypothetical protein R3Y54_06105 [Eubacteriales bacterium]
MAIGTDAFGSNPIDQVVVPESAFLYMSYVVFEDRYSEIEWVVIPNT